MGFFDDIGNAFKSAYEAVADAADGAWSFAKKVLTNASLTIADGANLFVSGWRDVFSGNFQQGLSKIAVGLVEAVGLLPTKYASRYEDALGQASLWSLQQSKTRDKQICFSEYVEQVKQNFKRLDLDWTDKMPDILKQNLHDMPWINPGC